MTDRMTSAELRAALARKKTEGRVKGAEKVTVEGITFDSKKEADRWQELRLMQRAGEISDLKRQVPFSLFGRDSPILTPTGRKMLYLADFTYIDHRLGDVFVVEDAKGWETEVFKIKRAILAAQGVEVTTV